ncbi:MAG: hypothetical protein CVU50_07535 [Candidatus Cloacimonetes bacterium HGW-Cloacimonetes-3]|nr:MAG: hypothetical protein CVU50_07535 [Candidatus Cloacimonetes bacterium HGW-Cloacimonetes-3]PKN96270.1 MAG: hypothetical protein CVU43_21560 [Chloroflexi bacterium HGW-Chloroflexi-5]
MAECKCDCGSSSNISCDTGCVTNDAPASVYACTGASNVGIITLELTKALHLAGKYKMGCAVCVGAGDCACGSVTAPDTPKDLLIDGCAVACLKKMFDKQGKTNYKHVIITQLGIKKEGTFSFDPALIDILVQKVSDKGL